MVNKKGGGDRNEEVVVVVGRGHVRRWGRRYDWTRSGVS